MPEGCATFHFPRHGESKVEINSANQKVTDLCVDTLAWQQAQRSRLDRNLSGKDGHWYASLIANNPRAVQRFADHEHVANLLAQAGEIEALAQVAASGYLPVSDSREYRKAHRELCAL